MFLKKIDDFKNHILQKVTTVNAKTTKGLALVFFQLASFIHRLFQLSSNPYLVDPSHLTKNRLLSNNTAKIKTSYTNNEYLIAKEFSFDPFQKTERSIHISAVPLTSFNFTQDYTSG